MAYEAYLYLRALLTHAKNEKDRVEGFEFFCMKNVMIARYLRNNVRINLLQNSVFGEIIKQFVDNTCYERATLSDLELMAWSKVEDQKKEQWADSFLSRCPISVRNNVEWIEYLPDDKRAWTIQRVMINNPDFSVDESDPEKPFHDCLQLKKRPILFKDEQKPAGKFWLFFYDEKGLPKIAIQDIMGSSRVTTLSIRTREDNFVAE